MKLLDDMRRERQRLSASPAGGKVADAIKRATPSGARTYREIVQDSAIAVLSHYGQHRDRRVLEQLLEAVGDDRSRAALTSWLCTHGPLAADGSGTLKHVRDKGTQVALATLDPYWKHYPRPATPPFDPIAELERVERRIAKYGSNTPGSAHMHLRKHLRSLIQRYRA